MGAATPTPPGLYPDLMFHRQTATPTPPTPAPGAPPGGDGATAPSAFPYPLDVPPTYAQSRHSDQVRAQDSTPAPGGDVPLDASQVRDVVRPPLSCAIEAQRTLTEVHDRGLFGTPQGRDMIAYATAWAILSYPKMNPAPHPTPEETPTWNYHQ